MQISFNVKGQTGSIPVIGLGTVGLNDRCIDSCVEALKAGYRHLDTALSYGNHVDVGEAIRRSGVPREEIFVTTKIAFCPFIDAKEADKVWLYDAVNQKGNEEKCINLCLEQLGLDYVDLLLVHNPCVSKEEYGAACLPHFFEYFNYKDLPPAIRPDILPDGSRLRDVLQKAKLDELLRACDKDKSYNIRKKTWAALEKALSDGKCKYIGVSNYPAPLLKEMESYATTAMPAVNQVELTPWFARKQLRETANELGTAIVAYGTGQTLNIRRKNNETIQTIATKIGKSPMQVILRWNWQSGIASIPNSRSPNHIRENFAIWDFELSDEDMRQLNELDEDYPFYWDPVPAIATVDGNNVDKKQGEQGPKRPAQTPTPKSSAKKQKKLSPSALAAAILRGVTMRPSGKWQAQLYFAGKSRYIGVFDTREKAALAYEIVREKLKPEQSAAAEGTLTSKQTEAAVNAARKAAFEGVNESDPC